MIMLNNICARDTIPATAKTSCWRRRDITLMVVPYFFGKTNKLVGMVHGGDLMDDAKMTEVDGITSEKALRREVHETIVYLLEDEIAVDDFEKTCDKLDCGSFTELAEERFLGGCCGFVLCPQSIIKTNTQQRFKIRSNRVYDVTERIWFCSDICYRHFECTRQQLPTAPIWVTGGKRPVQLDMEFLHKCDTKGLIGLEVDLKVESVIEDMKKAKLKEERYEKSDKSSDSEPEETAVDISHQKSDCKQQSKDEIMEISKSLKLFQPPDKDKVLEKLRSKHGTKPKVLLVEPQPLQESKVVTNAHDGDWKAVLTVIESWITKDTVTLLNGRSAESRNSIEKTDISNAAPCKLNRDLTDFEKMVQNYYAGDRVRFLEKQNSTEKEELTDVRLPLVDSHNQLQHRREIVLDRLNKVWTKLLHKFDLSETEITSELKLLVKSFHLIADNISLKPSQWSLMGLAVLFLLAKFVPNIDEKFWRDSSQKSVTEYLKDFGLQKDDFYASLNNLITK